MLLFKKIRWMNLLSTGNQFTEVLLNKSKSTLILGSNGSGKCVRGSTEIDVEIEDPLTKDLFEEFLKNSKK